MLVVEVVGCLDVAHSWALTSVLELDQSCACKAGLHTLELLQALRSTWVLVLVGTVRADRTDALQTPRTYPRSIDSEKLVAMLEVSSEHKAYCLEVVDSWVSI